MDLPPFHNSSFCWAFLLTPSCLCLFFYSPCFLNYTGVIQVVVGIILLFWEWWLFMITAENFFGDNRNSRSENIFKCFHFLQRNSLLLIFGHDFLQQRIATYSIMYRNVCNFINIHMEKKENSKGGNWLKSAFTFSTLNIHKNRKLHCVPPSLFRTIYGSIGWNQQKVFSLHHARKFPLLFFARGIWNFTAGYVYLVGYCFKQ